MSIETAIILANFGGPRSLEEIGPFLTELLTDEDVIRTFLPRVVERWLFKKIALRRVGKVSADYDLIGGRSPLFKDTETLAQQLREKTRLPVITFHRYLPATHAQFLSEMHALSAVNLRIVPMYPQFSYSTTGSIARFFERHLSESMTRKMQWVRSYADHPFYIRCMQNCIRDFLEANRLQEKEVFLFFSAHGLPQKFVNQGDPYQRECYQTYEAAIQAFPSAYSLLAFQSKFGAGKWLQPYTSQLSNNPEAWSRGRKTIVFVPLSFTSDHLETLYEIEHTYVTAIQKRGLHAYRCPALNLRADWVEALALLAQTPTHANKALIRP